LQGQDLTSRFAKAAIYNTMYFTRLSLASAPFHCVSYRNSGDTAVYGCNRLFERYPHCPTFQPFKAEWSLYVPAALTLSNPCILYFLVLFGSHCKQRLFP
jgi:hypothetical protein